MAVKVSYPGVYIDEFSPAGPIAGTGTSTTAILGPFAEGPIVGPLCPQKEPDLVTSWDEFRATYGYHPAPGTFTWYAVRGFFQNGGTTCYPYRISNASYAQVALTGLSGANPITLGTIYALEPGEIDTAILVKFAEAANPVLPAGTKLYSAIASGSVNGSTISLTTTGDPSAGTDVGASAFRNGDWVQVLDSTGSPLGPLTRIKSVTPGDEKAPGGKLIVDERLGLQSSVQVKLVYGTESDVRILVTDISKFQPNLLTAGLVIQFLPPTSPSKPPYADVVEVARVEQLTKDFKTYRLTLRNGLVSKIDPAATTTTVQSKTFDVSIAQGSGTPYSFVNLSSDPESDSYYATIINDFPNLVYIKPADVPPIVRSPVEMIPNFQEFSVGPDGNDEDLTKIGDNEYATAFDQIRQLPDVRLVSAPDGYPKPNTLVTTSVYAAMIAHCEQMGDRFAVIDSAPGLRTFGEGSIETARAALDSAKGYAALYYPWIQVPPAGHGIPLYVPPSGHICGMMAYVDQKRGVFKAPANQILQGVTDVQQKMTDADHGLLNLQGINVIRVFVNGGRPYVYGARTTATDSSWQYVNIRRLFLYLEKSIQDGIRWAVFEPNNTNLWDKLQHTINSFLSAQWKAGALFGTTPKEAYYVRIDETLNPFDEQSQGRLHIEIGVRPTYTAEFIIVRIGIWDGTTSVSEG